MRSSGLVLKAAIAVVSRRMKLLAEQLLKRLPFVVVNVNGSTSGAEIGVCCLSGDTPLSPLVLICRTVDTPTGGPFGGNKSTGWGRESGGDAWKMVSFDVRLPLSTRSC